MEAKPYPYHDRVFRIEDTGNRSLRVTSPNGKVSALIEPSGNPFAPYGVHNAYASQLAGDVEEAIHGACDVLIELEITGRAQEPTADQAWNSLSEFYESLSDEA